MEDKRNLYWYNARIVSVYDGDTVTIDIDLGLGSWLMKQKVRLYGIDTPELRGKEREEGLKVRDLVRNWLPVGAEVLIKTHKDKSGKFGRWLAEIYPAGFEESLNEYLVKNGHAKEYLKD